MACELGGEENKGTAFREQHGLCFAGAREQSSSWPGCHPQRVGARAPSSSLPVPAAGLSAFPPCRWKALAASTGVGVCRLHVVVQRCVSLHDASMLQPGAAPGSELPLVHCLGCALKHVALGGTCVGSCASPGYPLETSGAPSSVPKRGRARSSLVPSSTSAAGAQHCGFPPRSHFPPRL